MHLRTLGKLVLEHTDFTRPKPLLLLAYLALEGRQERRHVAELFWPDAADRMKSLTVALTRLRQGAPGAIDAADDRVWATADSDARRFLALLDRGESREALDLYRGAFLEGFYLKGWSAELEEWTYRTREHLAARARRAMLELAQAAGAQARFSDAAECAASAYALPGAPAPEPDEIARLHTLLRAGDHPLAREAREEASGFGLDLAPSTDDARERLRRLDSPRRAPHDLPKRPTAFIGRDLELTEVASLLSRRDCPLLTLVGPAGAGKTRLALQVAHEQTTVGEQPGGVSFVGLESLSTTRALAHAIAHALSVDLADSSDPIAKVAAHIGDQPMLLVLDDVEHLVGGVGAPPAPGEDAALAIAELAAACPHLTLLVTSRERLNLEEERVFPVIGLPYPTHDLERPDEARRYDAVALFERRARRARADFEMNAGNVADVLRVCRLVEGLPLALELSALWVRVMPVDEIAASLEEGLDLLATPTRNVPERHRSMRAAFDGSWRILSPKEQRVLRLLAVFRGGFRREAAREVAGGSIPILAALVDKSLLRVDATGRYERHPLVHEYTIERLGEHPEERAAAIGRHRSCFVALLREWEDELAGGPRQREALTVVEADLENVLRAWRGAADDGDVEAMWDACRPLQSFFIQRGGLLREAVAAFADASAAVEASAGDGAGPLLGRLLVAEAWFRFLLGDPERSAAAAQQGVEALHTGASQLGAGSSDAARHRRLTLDRAVTSGLNTLGHIAKQRGDLPGAEGYFRDALALAREWDNQAQVAIITNNMAILRKAMGDYEGAEELYRRALTINRTRQNDRSVVRNLTNLGGLMVAAERSESAHRLLQEGMDLAEKIGYEDLLPSLRVNQAGAEYLCGRYEQAAGLYREALEAKRGSGERAVQADAHCGLGRVAMAQGDFDVARRHLETALALAWEMQYAEVVFASLVTLAELHYAVGDPAEAAVLVGAIRLQPALARSLADRADALARALGPGGAAPPPASGDTLEPSAAMALERVVGSVLRGAAPRP